MQGEKDGKDYSCRQGDQEEMGVGEWEGQEYQIAVPQRVRGSRWRAEADGRGHDGQARAACTMQLQSGVDRDP